MTSPQTARRLSMETEATTEAIAAPTVALTPEVDVAPTWLPVSVAGVAATPLRRSVGAPPSGDRGIASPLRRSTVGGGQPTTGSRVIRRDLATYQTMDPAMAKFAKRGGGSVDKMQDPTSPSMALGLPRNDDGSLTQEAIDLMLRIQADEAQMTIDNSSKATIQNMPTTKKGLADLKKRLADYDLNKTTGKTRLPELLGYKSGGQDKISEITTSGVKMRVFHNTKDVNFRPRLAMFEGAIKKVIAAGFKFPGVIDVHLPKLGREIDATQLCETSGTPRAVFNPPNFIHLSSAVVGNPIDTTLAQADGTEAYKNLSTTLDPKSGAGTVVHEMGHMLHYHAAPDRFFGLHGAGFTREGSDIAAKVSGYASGHPREFVAEVFLGLVYGKNWDDEILEMYEAYGGPMTDKIRQRIAKAQAKEKSKGGSKGKNGGKVKQPA